MLTLAFSFPAGRYHATPWGRHVNEADVAWPPDLWRLTRALIATWHRKLDSVVFPQERLVDLLATVVSEAPHYQLPEAVHFHTRHYMPVRDKPSLIFDAFAQVCREAELIVHWPQLSLNPDQILLLDELLAVMGYLGRAESWVEAKRLDKWMGRCDCYPSADAVDLSTGEVKGDLVRLWLPQCPDRYAEVRKNLHSAALARTQAELRKRHGEAVAKGKASRLPDLSKGKIASEVEATLPEDWLAALSLDTGELQAAGWSAPPAACQAYYLRPKDALRFMAASTMPARIRPVTTVTTFRFAMYGKPLPLMKDAVRVGEWLRAAAMSVCGEDAIPSAISGHGLAETNRHAHAFWLPEDMDDDGRIDHVLIHVPAGVSGAARTAIQTLRRLWNRDGQEWQLIFEGAGSTATFAEKRNNTESLCSGATVFESVTPYLMPWHKKANFGVDAQIRRECSARGLAEPVSIEVLPHIRIAGQVRRPVDFHRFRSKRGLTQPDTRGTFIKLVFPSTVQGPLALGYGCHFGLGMFVPRTDVNDEEARITK